MKKTEGSATQPSSELKATGYIKIAVLGFAISAIWSALHTIILPVRLLDIVSESRKNTFLGIITFSGLILAMLTQPVAGALSDRTNSPLGRRRPYILLGTLLAAVILPFLVLTRSLILLFLTVCLLQISTNIAQSPYQTFIPELVPLTNRGRASGVKSLFEILGGVSLLYPVAILLDRDSLNAGALWLLLALIVLMSVILAGGILTVLLVREPNSDRAKSFPVPSYLKVSVRGNRKLIYFLLSRLLFFLAFTTIQTFALFFLRDVVRVESPAKATADFSVVAVLGMMLATYPAGRLSDIWGRREVGVTAGAIGAIGVMSVFIFQRVYGLVILSAGLIGISFGAFLSANWAHSTDLAQPGDEGRHLGITNMANAGGSALARLMGYPIDYFNGLKPNSGYSVMLLICLISLALGSMILAKKTE